MHRVDLVGLWKSVFGEQPYLEKKKLENIKILVCSALFAEWIDYENMDNDSNKEYYQRLFKEIY